MNLFLLGVAESQSSEVVSIDGTKLVMLLALVPLFGAAGFMIMRRKERNPWIGAIAGAIGAFLAPFFGLIALLVLACIPKQKPVYPAEPPAFSVQPLPGTMPPAPPPTQSGSVPYAPPTPPPSSGQ